MQENLQNTENSKQIESSEFKQKLQDSGISKIADVVQNDEKLELSESSQNPEQTQVQQSSQARALDRQLRALDIPAESVKSARQSEQAKLSESSQLDFQIQAQQLTQVQGLDRRLRVLEVMQYPLDLSQIQTSELSQIIEKDSQLQTSDFVSKLEQIQTSTFVQNQTQNQVQTSANSKENDIVKTTNQIGFVTSNVVNTNTNKQRRKKQMNIESDSLYQSLSKAHDIPRVRLQIPITNRDILLKAS